MKNLTYKLRDLVRIKVNYDLYSHTLSDTLCDIRYRTLCCLEDAVYHEVTRKVWGQVWGQVKKGKL